MRALKISLVILCTSIAISAHAEKTPQEINQAVTHLYINCALQDLKLGTNYLQSNAGLSEEKLAATNAVLAEAKDCETYLLLLKAILAQRPRVL